MQEETEKANQNMKTVQHIATFLEGNLQKSESDFFNDCSYTYKGLLNYKFFGNHH